jgi:hypothetical protein
MEMPTQFSRRSVIALLVGLGAWAGSVRASDPAPATPAPTTVRTVFTLPGGYKVTKQEVQQTSASTVPNIGTDPDKQTVRPRPGCEWWEDHVRRCGCWADYNSDYNCGSFHSECRFIFGSCRQFWREPCFTAPPPSPFGPEYDCPPTHPWKNR